MQTTSQPDADRRPTGLVEATCDCTHVNIGPTGKRINMVAASCLGDPLHGCLTCGGSFKAVA